MSNYKEVWIEENIFLCLINLFGDKNFLIDLRFRGSAFFCIFNYNSVTFSKKKKKKEAPPTHLPRSTICRLERGGRLRCVQG